MQRKGSGKQPLVSRSVSPGVAAQRSASLPRHASPDVSTPAAQLQAGAQPGQPGPAGAQQRRASQLPHRLTQGPVIAPGQPAAGTRDREKLVKLPESESFLSLPESADPQVPSVAIFQDLELAESLARPRRISAVSLADSFDRRKLEKKLRAKGGGWFMGAYPDVLYGHYHLQGTPEAEGEVFYFDYGVVVLWGLSKAAEQTVLYSVLADCTNMPHARKDVETDVLHFKYVVTEKPNIQNDTVTINYRFAPDHKTKLAIAFALSQSTKLSLYEDKVLQIVEATKDIPEELATQGVVHSFKRKEITQLIGEVFIQKSEVNLLSTVLDTPEFFWGEHDRYVGLYRSVIEYLEFDERVELLNNRFQVLQELLEIARSQQNVAHTAQMDWVVIGLIILDLITLLLQFIGSLGFVHR